MWNVFWTQVLQARIEQLEKKIQRLKRDNADLRNSSDVRLFIGVIRGISEVRKDPTASMYLLGNTLGPNNRDWRRVKNLLPPRYRLFFKFFSQHTEIFFVWVNDENTLRKAGAISDCYEYFKRLLSKKEIPSDRDTLKRTSSPYTKI